MNGAETATETATAAATETAKKGPMAPGPAQAAFAAALWQPAAPVPPGLRAWHGASPAARLAVHRNNVMASLVQALAETFPVVRQWVGETFFAAMAAHFVRAQPPRTPVLAEYGDGFADWLAAFPPAAAWPCLPDVARLERARVRAHHASDAEPLPPSLLAAALQRPDGLEHLHLGVHPSVAVLSSCWAVVSLWAAHQHDTPAQVEAALARVRLAQPEAALVQRQGDEVTVTAIAGADAVFVQALQAGLALGPAVQAATAAAWDETAPSPAPSPVPFEPAATLALLLRTGGLCAATPPGDPR